MGKTVAVRVRGSNPLFGKTFWKCKIKFESMSLGSVLSSHDRCVKYNTSNLIMVSYSSLKKKQTLRPTFWGLEICLKPRDENSRVTETYNKEKLASIKNFFYRTCWWQVLADKKNSIAQLDLTQLLNISTTTAICRSNISVPQLFAVLKIIL